MSGKNLIFLGVLAVLTSCGSDSGTKVMVEKKIEETKQAKKLENTNTDFTYKKRHAVELSVLLSKKSLMQNESLMNTFLIDLNLRDALTTDSTLTCAKMNLSSRAETATILAGTQKATLQVKLDNDEMDSTLHCRLINDGKEISTHSFELQKTLILKNETHLKDLSIKSIGGFLSLDRLIFADDNTRLITDGAVLNLKVNEIYSDNGIIESFKDGAIQKENQNGLPGGIINVKADKAIGTLRVQMRGQNAGEQNKIPEKNLVVPAHDPATDSLADRTRTVRDRCYSHMRGEGGCGDNESYKVLVQRGHAGTQGARGNTGFIGFKGNDGGDTGIFNLETTSDDFLIQILKPIPGNGSAGGRGGEGSDGATGGNGGAYRFSNATYAGGAPGPVGITGANGADGQIGKIQEACFTNTTMRICNRQEK